MPIKFNPLFTITPKIAGSLIRIESVRERIVHLPMAPHVLVSLRETARLHTTHYSTMIEGNRLDPQQVKEVLMHKGHFPGRERDEREVQGYYSALAYVEQLVAKAARLKERNVQTIHSLVMNGGKSTTKPTPYRDGQNVIRDGRSQVIIYLPPEAHDVPALMKQLVEWIVESRGMPCPLIAAVAHYQFATIHPYFDGNGRTARLLTTFILHSGGYDLKGLYSLEEYYVRNLGAYYDAITIGPSHNYYLGRAEADISQWVEYFVEGMAISFENILKRMLEADYKGLPDQTELLRVLDPRQRKVLELFHQSAIITARQIGELFGFKPRTSAHLCKIWVDVGFLEVEDSSNKGRKYRLAKAYEKLITKQ